MGVDKPNVRFVIHATLPKSLEGYYQETGRAGRDGKQAACILFYHHEDVTRIRRMIEKSLTKNNNERNKKKHLENLSRMMSFCENKIHCRRFLQLNYFGEKSYDFLCCTKTYIACDNCQNRVNFCEFFIKFMAFKFITAKLTFCKLNFIFNY